MKEKVARSARNRTGLFFVYRGDPGEKKALIKNGGMQTDRFLGLILIYRRKTAINLKSTLDTGPALLR